jgi:prepilin-type processing-associated H-X9-DG protein
MTNPTRTDFTHAPAHPSSASHRLRARRALVVYFDGHVGEMTKADMLEIDKRGGANSVFWKAKQ